MPESTRKRTAAKKTSSEPNGGGGAAKKTNDPVEPAAPSSSIEAPSKSEMVPAFPEDVYRALSVADERQIAQELQGRAVTAMVYGFPQGGKQVTGLSWIGVREAVRQVNTRGYGRIHIDKAIEPKFEDVLVTVDTGKADDKGHPLTEERKAIRCTVFAADDMHGGGNFGTATQLCEMKLQRKGKDNRPIWQPDPFAATKALSKAERNALEPFLPLELVEELKALYRGEGKIEYIPGIGREVTEERPAALTDEKATAQVAQIRALYEELKKIAGLKLLPPARFNHYLTSAQHSHERLADFIDHLKNEIERAKKEATDAKQD